jgi:repressor LexA
MVDTQVAYPPLTDVGRKVLLAVAAFHVAHGYAPTVRELQAELGFASVSSVHPHLLRLRRYGLVDWVDGQIRTLTITSQAAIVIA